MVGLRVQAGVEEIMKTIEVVARGSRAYDEECDDMVPMCLQKNIRLLMC
jgi:hypothetical protein